MFQLENRHFQLLAVYIWFMVHYDFKVVPTNTNIEVGNSHERRIRGMCWRENSTETLNELGHSKGILNQQ